MGLYAGDKKAGNVRILYDTTWSTRGVLQCTGRKPRPKDAFDFQVSTCYELFLQAGLLLLYTGYIASVLLHFGG